MPEERGLDRTACKATFGISTVAAPRAAVAGPFSTPYLDGQTTQRGRAKLFGRESAAAVRRLDARRTRERGEKIEEEENQQSSSDIATLPR
ncbi:hypothetical protein C0993_008233 [Termitomyces sp. T159_Od127]|nr:hypothetical protein C0993_008233 [Termitomyces sp. T159_Od127]